MKAYPAYKDSGTPWLGNIPEHWKVKKLKHIGESSIGLTYNPTEIVEGALNGILILRSSNIQNGKLSLEDTVYVAKEIPEKLILKKGDILICSRNGSKALIGKNICIDEKTEGSSFGAFMTIFRTAYWGFASKIFNSDIFTSQSSLFLTTTINQLTQGTLNNLFIPFPPKEEQTIIAHFLDHKTTQIDDAIAKHRQLIELLREHRAALINEAVTKGLNPDAPMKDSGVEWIGEVPAHWEVKKLKHITTKIGSGKTPTGGAETYLKEGVVLLRSQNIYFDGLRLEDAAYISDEVHKSMNNSTVYSGDVLLNITGGSIGRCYFVDSSLGEANVNQHVCIVRPDLAQVRTNYLYYYLRSNLAQEQITMGQTGSNREGLNFEQLRQFLFPYPTIKEQLQIVNFIETETTRIDREIDLAQQEIALLEEYRQSLIAEAVTGKIDVRDYVLEA